MGDWSRGRDAGCPAPPAQIRACPLRHTAPTSGNDGRLRRQPYPTPRLGHGSPALGPVRAWVGRNSPWFHPFAPRTPQRVPPPCSPASSLLWMNPIASSLPSWVTAFSFPTRPRLSPGREQALPGPDTRFTYVHGFFDTAEPGRPSPYRSGRCCLRPRLQPRHFRSWSLRCSIACPYAPLPTLRRHPHECPRTARGETWMVRPFVSADFHRLSCAS